MNVGPTSYDADVAVVGAGPAGWALAAALDERGLSPVVVAPRPHDPWPATYGLWADELPDWIAARLDQSTAWFAHRWWRVGVAGHRLRTVDRPYVRLDNDVLRRALATTEAAAHTVRGVTHTARGSRVHTDGPDLWVRLVVDATGSSSPWTGVRPDVGGAQVAYGLVVPSEALPDPWRGPDTCILMDWRPLRADGHASLERAGDTTFLYVLDDGRHALVEETSLVRRPPCSVDDLRGRLAQRLGRDLAASAVAEERVHIPMRPGFVRHRRPDRVVAFGAAAGYVHPATGYSVGVSLRAAPRVADAIVEAWDVVPVAELAHRAAQAVWPLAQRRVRALHDVGLAALQRLDGDGVRTFFDVFFSLPQEQWSAYLRVDARPSEITTTMTAVFRRLPMRLRWALATAYPQGLLNAVTGGGS